VGGGSKPCTQNEHESWLADITHWRNERRIRIGYDRSRYDLPVLKWTQSSFMQPQMMVHDCIDPTVAVSEFHTQAPASEAWHLVEAAAGEFRLPDTP